MSAVKTEKKKFPTKRIVRGGIRSNIPYEKHGAPEARRGFHIVCLNLESDEDWDDHRRFVRACEEESSHNIREIVLHVVEVDRIHTICRILDRLLDENARFVQKILRLAEVHEAATDNVRRLAELSGFEVHARDDDEHAVLGER